MTLNVVHNSTPAAQVTGSKGSPYEAAAHSTQTANARLATLTRIGGRKTKNRRSRRKKYTKKKSHMKGGNDVVKVSQLPNSHLVKTHNVPSPADNFKHLTSINNQGVENSSTDNVTLVTSTQTGGRKHIKRRRSKKKQYRRRKTKKLYK